MSSVLAKPYVDAIYALMAEQKQWGPFIEALDALCQMDTIAKHLQQRFFDRQMIAEVMNPWLEKQHKSCQALFKMLLARRKLSLVHDIKVGLDQKIAASQGQQHVTVECAQKLSATEKKSIEKLVAEQVGSAVIDYEINESLMAGCKLRIGSDIIDLSLSGRVAKLINHLGNNTRG